MVLQLATVSAPEANEPPRSPEVTAMAEAETAIEKITLRVHG